MKLTKATSVKWWDGRYSGSQKGARIISELVSGKNEYWQSLENFAIQINRETKQDDFVMEVYLFCAFMKWKTLEDESKIKVMRIN